MLEQEAERRAARTVEVVREKGLRVFGIYELILDQVDNILNVITARLALPARRAGGQLEPHPAAIPRAAQQGARLTRQLLGFSRRQPFEPVRLSLQEFATQSGGKVRIRSEVSQGTEVTLRLLRTGEAADARPLTEDAGVLRKAGSSAAPWMTRRPRGG